MELLATLGFINPLKSELETEGYNRVATLHKAYGALLNSALQLEGFKLDDLGQAVLEKIQLAEENRNTLSSFEPVDGRVTDQQLKAWNAWLNFIDILLSEIEKISNKLKTYTTVQEATSAVEEYREALKTSFNEMIPTVDVPLWLKIVGGAVLAGAILVAVGYAARGLKG